MSVSCFKESVTSMCVVPTSHQRVVVQELTSFLVQVRERFACVVVLLLFSCVFSTQRPKIELHLRMCCWKVCLLSLPLLFSALVNQLTKIHLYQCADSHVKFLPCVSQAAETYGAAIILNRELLCRPELELEVCCHREVLDQLGE
ncbi:hypothetical protein VIGAN_05240800 [Vigna angularis var. angularis]|uniref:Uncharacterized protein n=1 Tax=Vigna angularis var. angularis TaxID=157739 RepID=A0A0S3S7J9_PHAAN|nr:hypothetical protein VIGAN_05240800 [Vigna angularis var. angularis]